MEAASPQPMPTAPRARTRTRHNSIEAKTPVTSQARSSDNGAVVSVETGEDGHDRHAEGEREDAEVRVGVPAVEECLNPELALGNVEMAAGDGPGLQLVEVGRSDRPEGIDGAGPKVPEDEEVRYGNRTHADKRDRHHESPEAQITWGRIL